MTHHTARINPNACQVCNQSDRLNIGIAQNRPKHFYNSFALGPKNKEEKIYYKMVYYTLHLI